MNRLHIPLLSLFALVVVASFLPGLRLWGIHHLAFYPELLRWLAIAAIGVTLIPGVSPRVVGGLIRLLKRPISRRNATAVAVVVGVVAVVMFAGFKSSTLILGDGQLIANSLQQLLEEHDTVQDGVREAITANRTSPGTTVVYYLAARSFGVAPAQSERVVMWLNCILGGFLAGGLSYVVLRSTASPETRLWLAVLVLGSGAVQLFFGYVENYALLMFLGACYVLLAVRSLAGKGPWWPALVMCVAAIGAHFEGIVLVPSLLFLIISRSGGDRMRSRRLMVTIVLVVTTAAATYVAGAYSSLTRFTLPLTANETSYGILSPAHAVDVLNQLLLLLPILPLAIVLAARHRGVEAAALRRSSWLASDLDGYFIAVLLGPLAILLVVFFPEIGMSRDWDLFSVLILGLVPFAVFAVNRCTADAEGRRALATLTLPAFLISVVLTVSWVGINASPDRSTARLETTLEYDLARADYVFENLALQYEKQNRMPDAIAALERAAALSQNPRYYFNLSQMYRIDGDVENADRLLKRLLTNQPDIVSARQILIRSLYARNRCAELVPVAREGTRVNPDNTLFHYYLGKCLVEAGDLPAARESLHAARNLGPPTSMLSDIHATLQAIREAGEQ